jgi:hypothetical protein
LSRLSGPQSGGGWDQITGNPARLGSARTIVAKAAKSRNGMAHFAAPSSGQNGYIFQFIKVRKPA